MKDCPSKFDISAVSRDKEKVKLVITQTGTPNHTYIVRNLTQIRGQDRKELAYRVCAEGASNVFYDGINNDIQMPSNGRLFGTTFRRHDTIKLFFFKLFLNFLYFFKL